jgi:hypothetical protein
LIRPETVKPICPGLDAPDEDVLRNLELLFNGPLTDALTVEIMEAKAVGNIAASMTIEQSGRINKSSEALPTKDSIKVTLLHGDKA